MPMSCATSAFAFTANLFQVAAHARSRDVPRQHRQRNLARLLIECTGIVPEHLPGRMVDALVVPPEEDGGAEGIDIFGALAPTDHQEDLQEASLRSQHILAGIHLEVAAVVGDLWTIININATGSHDVRTHRSININRIDTR